MSIQEKIKEEIKNALRAKDSLRLSVMRSISAAFTNELLNLKRKPTEELTNDEALAVIKKTAKQRRDSIEQYQKGNREDLAEKETQELKIIEEFLPEPLPYEEIKNIAQKKKDELNITDRSDIGRLIGVVIKETKDRASGQTVKQTVEELF